VPCIIKIYAVFLADFVLRKPMDFNFDSLFLLIGVAVFLVSIFGKRKKVQEAFRSVSGEKESADYYEYSDSELVEDSVESETSVIADIPENLHKSKSIIREESTILNKMEMENIVDSDVHDIEEKEVDHFDLREAVIMSTILERKYF